MSSAQEKDGANGAQRGVTLKQIAELAGCSTATVSAVLNSVSTTTIVSAATRERVLEVAREHDYRPNLSARMIRSRRSMQVGVLLRNNARQEHQEILSHPLTWMFLLGINEGLEAGNYMMSLLHGSNLSDEVLRPSALQGHLLDGLIVVSDLSSVSSQEIERLVPACVWLDSSVWRETNCVRRDEEAAGELAAQKLCEAGYRRFVYVDRPATSNPHYSQQLRRQGAMRVLESQRVDVQMWELNFWNDLSKVAAQLEQLEKQTSLIVNDAYACRTILDAALLTNLRPGRDFTIACCDENFNGTGFELTQKIIPHVGFNRFEAGKIAAQMMRRILQDGKPQPSVVLPVEWHAGTLTLSAKD
jgi:DNA-binding LacI/PurR family transcriptional regulator